jgi:tungstate transport system substrate-binding protein
LLNVYSIIAGNAEKNSKLNAEMAQNLVDFITSDKIQQLIGDYGFDVYEMQLFTPCAGNEPAS